MAHRSQGVKTPDGWTDKGHAMFEFEDGATIEREINPDGGIIEWCVLTAGGELIYTGQDLHSAFALGAGIE